MDNTNQQSDHFDGRHFHNLSGRGAKGFASLLKWAFTRKSERWPRHIENSNFPPPVKPETGQWSITFINHSTFLIQTKDCAILTDPIFSERASPIRSIGPRRVREPGIKLELLPEIDLILLSHNHYDHLDLNALKKLRSRREPRIITLLGNGKLLRKNGLRDVVELDWWETKRFSSQIVVTATPAEHFSGRSLRDRDRSLWGGFLLQIDDTKMLFAGDSGYGLHFQEINRRFGPVDVALLPIGAYRPRWFMQDIHMDPADALLVHRELGSKLSIGMHYGTFRLTDEGVEEPVREWERAAQSLPPGAGEIGVLGFGESRMFALSPVPK